MRKLSLIVLLLMRGRTGFSTNDTSRRFHTRYPPPVRCACALSLSLTSLFLSRTRAQMHLLQFTSLQSLDLFFRRIPSDKHVEWGMRFGKHVVDGSPTWEVMQVI